LVASPKNPIDPSFIAIHTTTQYTAFINKAILYC